MTTDLQDKVNHLDSIYKSATNLNREKSFLSLNLKEQILSKCIQNINLKSENNNRQFERPRSITTD